MHADDCWLFDFGLRTENITHYELTGIAFLSEVLGPRSGPLQNECVQAREISKPGREKTLILRYAQACR